MVVELIAFAFAALVMTGAFRSAAFAFSGTDRSGLHALAQDADGITMLSAEELDSRYQRRHRMQQAALYLAALGVTAALTAMIVGALLA